MQLHASIFFCFHVVLHGWFSIVFHCLLHCLWIAISAIKQLLNFGVTTYFGILWPTWGILFWKRLGKWMTKAHYVDSILAIVFLMFTSFFCLHGFGRLAIIVNHLRSVSWHDFILFVWKTVCKSMLPHYALKIICFPFFWGRMVLWVRSGSVLCLKLLSLRRQSKSQWRLWRPWRPWKPWNL